MLKTNIMVLNEIQLQQLENNSLMNWLEKEKGYRFNEHERVEMEMWRQLFVGTYSTGEHRKAKRDEYRQQRNDLRERNRQLREENKKLQGDYNEQTRINIELLTNRNYEPTETSSLFRGLARENQKLKEQVAELTEQIENLTDK